jgi:hypothetical protein
MYDFGLRNVVRNMMQTGQKDVVVGTDKTDAGSKPTHLRWTYQNDQPNFWPNKNINNF